MRPGSARRNPGSALHGHRRLLAALDAGLVLTAVGQTTAAAVGLATGHLVLAAIALATLPALARLRRELRRRLVQARGGWWPVPFAALATLGTLVAAVLWVGVPSGLS